MIHQLLDNISRARKRKTTAILLSIVFIIVIFSVANPSTSSFWPKCLFKLITGFDCPICGLQRSLHAFLHGDFSHAIAYNYYLILALPYTFLCLVFTLLPQGKTKKRVKNIIISKPVSSSETSIIFDDEAKTSLHSIKTSTHKDAIK